MIFTTWCAVAAAAVCAAPSAPSPAAAAPPQSQSVSIHAPVGSAIRPVASAPAIRVALSRPYYTIRVDPKSGAPMMPADVVASAAAVNWPQGAPAPAAFTWRIFLDWDFYPHPTHHDLSKREFVQPSPFKVDFGKQIRGGLLTVVAKADLNGAQVCGQARAYVLGENPTRPVALTAFPRTRFGLIASKIGTAESGLRQFTSASGQDHGGLPLVSRTQDVGMMQINAPSGAITSSDQVWDWRANVRRGMEMLDGKRRNSFLASRHAVGLRRVQEDCDFQIACLNVSRYLLGMRPVPTPAVEPLSDRPGTGIAPGDPDVDHLALSQWERDAIRRYNGGQEYAYRVTTDPVTHDIRRAGWEVDPTRGGVRERSGDPAYVVHVLRARSGLTLPPPPKPKPNHPSRARRRHRRHPRR
jgi:hypothetical protein